MNKLHGGYSTINLRKNIQFPENLKTNISNNKIKKRKSFNKDIYSININNFNINTRRNLFRNCSSKTIELVTDFKKVLEQTEAIKKRILNNKFNKFQKSKNNNKVKLNRNAILMNKLQNYLSPIKKNKTIELNYEADDSLYFPASYKYSQSNKNIHNINIFPPTKINKNVSFKKNLDMNILKLENKNLKKESDSLINESFFLCSKIKEYKIKNNFNINTKSINYCGENPNGFINSIKNSLNYNVNNNLELSKTIVNTLKKIQEMEKDINVKIKKEKRNNFIKKRIEENSKKFNKLKQENKLLNYKLEKLKIFFEELKTKEKILFSKYEYRIKSRKDKNVLISILKSSIKELNKSQEALSKNELYPAKNLKININSNDIYSKEINKLNLIYKFLENKKNILIKENKILKKENTKKNILTNEKSETKILKEKLNILHKDIYEKKLKLEKKEKQIKILKDIINKSSNALKEKNMKDEVFQLDLDKLTKEDYDDTEYMNLLIKNKLKNLTNKRRNNQQMRNIKNINNTKTYEGVIKAKDLEISGLEEEVKPKNGILKIIENKVKPLYKKNNPISKTSSFLNSISDNDNKREKVHFKVNINWKNNQENLFDKIRKRKNKFLYLDNIGNNFQQKFSFNYK